MKQFKVYELLADYVPTDPVTDDVFNIVITNTVKDDEGTEHTVTLASYTYDNIISELLRNYADWQYTMFYIDSRYNNHNDEVADFVSEWQNYKSNMMDNWRRICIAFAMDYNPLYNYERIEDGINHNNDSVGTYNDSKNIFEQLADSTVTHAYNPSDNPDGIKSEFYSTTYDDTTVPKLTGQNITKGTEKTTTDGGRTQTTYENLASTERNSNSDHHLEARGNIGVVSNQKMIQSELNLRKLNLLQHIIRGFAEYALSYAPDCEDDDDCYFLYL